MLSIVLYCGTKTYRQVFISLLHTLIMRNCVAMLETNSPWKVFSWKWLTPWWLIVRSWRLCQDPLYMRTIIEPSLWQKIQVWLLHQSTLLSNVIGLDYTLEINLWFGISSQKTEGRYFHQRFTRWIIFQDWKVAMLLVRLNMRGSVAKKSPSAINGDIMVQKVFFKL